MMNVVMGMGPKWKWFFPIVEPNLYNGGYIYPGLEDVLFRLHEEYDLFIISKTPYIFRKGFIFIFYLLNLSLKII